ncbi:hypothetical protein Ciccas_000368 [Cichlidogyrus casuarinus]|uniref:Uncharacterized protein n=1 Tax=Cichlidogyrus casuarinus TaxID=1844966 RepID=A0ABD2QNE7_9PLAT
MRVKVTLWDSAAAPIYEDVDHRLANENAFMLHTMSPEHRSLFEDLLANNCRFPLPDFYYLLATNYRDRKTKAVLRSCKKPLFSPEMTRDSEFCTAGVLSGQQFYQRTLNESCPNQDVTPLAQERGSAYCTMNSALINSILEEKITERDAPFQSASSKSCEEYRRVCYACLEKAKSLDVNCEFDVRIPFLTDQQMNADMNPLMNKCCAIKCYNLPECLGYFNSDCYTSANVKALGKCLEGDTLKLSLRPQYFTESSTNWQCHLKLRPRDFLYSVSVELSSDSLPFSTNFEMKIKEQHANEELSLGPINLKNHIPRDSQFVKEALLVSKNSRSFIHLLKNASTGGFGATLPPKPPVSRRGSSGVSLVEFQVTKPFAVNSLDWQSSQNASCLLDISRLTTKQPLYLQSEQSFPAKLAGVPFSNADPFLYHASQINAEVEIKLSGM